MVALLHGASVLLAADLLSEGLFAKSVANLGIVHVYAWNFLWLSAWVSLGASLHVLQS